MGGCYRGRYGEVVPTFEGNGLRCPNCGDPWGLHHDVVVLHVAAEEDRDGSKVTVVGQGAFEKGREQVVVEPCLRDDFAGRRDDLRIGLWCELCDSRSELILVQHKGATVVFVETGVARRHEGSVNYPTDAAVAPPEE